MVSVWIPEVKSFHPEKFNQKFQQPEIGSLAEDECFFLVEINLEFPIFRTG